MARVRGQLKAPQYDLEHPDVMWWIAEDDYWFKIASDAKNGCIVSKAELYSHLKIFADYEEKADASLIRQRLLDEIREAIAREDVDPFHVILAALALPCSVRKDIDIAKYAPECDSRIFRLARRIPEILRGLPACQTNCDWMYYQATTSKSEADYEKASVAGSLEATLYLARITTPKLARKYYLRVIRDLGFTGLVYEYAQRTNNKAILLRLGTPRALVMHANMLCREGKRVKYVKQWCRDNGVPLSSKDLLPLLQERPADVDEDTLYLNKLSDLLGYPRT